MQHYPVAVFPLDTSRGCSVLVLNYTITSCTCPVCGHGGTTVGRGAQKVLEVMQNECPLVFWLVVILI